MINRAIVARAAVALALLLVAIPASSAAQIRTPADYMAAIEGFVPRDLLTSEAERFARVDRLRQVLPEDVGEPVVLELDLIAIDVISVRSESPEVEAGG